MVKIVDARVVRTKEKLFDAYLTLVATKHPEEITIQELTQLAGINRVTFYKHFQHLADFHEVFMEHHILKLYSYMKPLNYKPYTRDFELKLLIELFTYIQENERIYKVLFTSEYLPTFNRQLLLFFQQKIAQSTHEQLKLVLPGNRLKQEIVGWYGVSALFGTILMWVQADFPYSPEELASSLVKLMPYY